MSTTTHQGAVGAETMTAADPDINEFGRVVWHSSDEDSGPDVGVTIGFGSGRALWFGEISKKMHEEEGAEAAELGDHFGTWIILYDDNEPRGEQATVIGKAIPYVGTNVCDAISASLRAATPARTTLPTALEAWRPISEAPKDGTEIWAWLYDSGVRKLRWWSAEEICEEEGRNTPEAYQAGFYEVADRTEWWNPAWWLPADRLPAPPSSSGQGGR